PSICLLLALPTLFTSCVLCFSPLSLLRISSLPLPVALPISVSKSGSSSSGGTSTMGLRAGGPGCFGTTGLTLGDSEAPGPAGPQDRKSTRLNSSHQINSYAVFCLKKKNKTDDDITTDHTPNA